MYQLGRLMVAIRVGSDSCAPFYGEFGEMNSLPYEEAKKRLRAELSEYLRKSYEMRRRYNGDSTTFDRYVRDNATVAGAMGYILGLFRHREGFDRLINTLNSL